MLEKDLVSRLLRTLRKLPNSWWWKIPDPTRCPRCQVITLTDKKPFDIVGTYQGNFIAIEVKVRSVKDLTKHQEANLKLVCYSGGTAIVALPDKIYHYNIYNKKFRLLESSAQTLNEHITHC